MSSRISQVFTLVLIAILSTSSQVYGQKGYAKTGIYLGGAVSYHSIEGSFDGQSYLQALADLILFPRMSSGLGWCVILGGRLVLGAVEARYIESRHDFIFLDMSGKADHSIFVLNFKFHFDNHERM